MVNFCLYVTLPFNIFHSFQMEWEWSMLKSFAQVLFLATGYCILSIIMSCIFYRKAEPDKRKPLRYGTIVSNGGFLGNPVIEGIYGTNGLFYASVFMLPVRIVMWSVGTSCFMKEKSESLVKKVLTHPCIVAIYLGLFVMIAGMSFPVSVENTISGISSCNTPLSMMLVGMILAPSLCDAGRDESERNTGWNNGALHHCPTDPDPGNFIRAYRTASDSCITSGNYGYYCGDADTGDNCTAVCQISWE